MLILKLLATILFFGFIAISVYRWGIPHSYSMLAYKWNKTTWTIITIVTAFLITPVLIELGTLSAFQFLGFLTPVWLILVATTPNFLTDKTQNILHNTFTGLCVVSNLLWLTLVTNYVWIGLLVMALIAIIALLTKSIKSSYIFWIEMIIFLTTFICL